MLCHKINVETQEFSAYLNQSSQQVPIKFSFLSKKNKQCHPLVMCKDYLHDVLYSIIGERDISIYGFAYGKGSTKIDMDQIKLLVVFPDSYTEERIENHCDTALKLLHNYENIGEFLGRSTVATAVTKNNIKGVVFKGPKEWLQIPAFISLYTMLIRLGAKEFNFSTDKELQKLYLNFIKTKTPDNDKFYLEVTHKFLTPILKNRKKLFKVDEQGFYTEYKEKTEIMSTHNYRGILSLCTNGYHDISKEILIKYINKE